MNDKLTAYALNELPPDERAALEQQMTTDPALREEAEAMKAFCGILKEQVGQPQTEQEALTGDQRSEVLKAFLNTPRKVIRPPFWKRAEFISTAIAAGLALTLLVPSGVLLERRETLPEAAVSEQVTVLRTVEPPKEREFLGKLTPERQSGLKNADLEAAKTITGKELAEGKSDKQAAAQQPLGGVPAAPLAMPAPPPAPITTPGNSAFGRGMSEAAGLGSDASKKKEQAAAAPVGSLKAVKPMVGSGTASEESLQSPRQNQQELQGRADRGSMATNPSIDGLLAMGDSVPDPAAAAPKPAAGPVPAPVPSIVAATGASTRNRAAAPATKAAPAKSAPAVTSSSTAVPAASFPTSPATPPVMSEPFADTASKPAAPVAAAATTISGVAGRLSDGSEIAGRQPAAPAEAPAPAPTSAPHAYANTGMTAGVTLQLKSVDDKAVKDAELNTSGAVTDLDSNRPVPALEQTVRLKRNVAGETYTPIYENPFQAVAQEPLSTFSIDVDTASYANVRRFLNSGQRPPADAVRLEELVNYFPYAYEPPADDRPFAVQVDIAEAPWKPEHRLARIAIKGRVNPQERAPANFVFLVDVSGSMDEPDKLPLVKQSLLMLTERIAATDHVAIVTYAGSTAVTLPSTPGTEKAKIVAAIESLGAGGSTNGEGGIRLAYEQAQKHFQKEGVNRVILCTDGDFNVGISSPEELQKLIEEKAKSRVFLSVLGYGTGNLKDRTMETLADRGNGNYAYIDSLSEARKVLVEQMNATLVTIAKDVKIQVEFNPAQVQAYRLLGYENRVMAKQDFNNDRKDAGEIGEGHTVTALYEIVPSNVKLPDGRPLVDNLKYAPRPAVAATPAPVDEAAKAAPASNETMTVKLRYKQPLADTSVLMEVPVTDKEKKIADAPGDFKFAAAVTGFGMLLRNSQHAGELTWDQVRQLALAGKGPDDLGYRGEFLQLIDKARGIVTDRPQ